VLVQGGMMGEIFSQLWSCWSASLSSDIVLGEFVLWLLFVGIGGGWMVG
jgi:hypothetical protein